MSKLNPVLPNNNIVIGKNIAPSLSAGDASGSIDNILIGVNSASGVNFNTIGAIIIGNNSANVGDFKGGYRMGAGQHTPIAIGNHLKSSAYSLTIGNWATASSSGVVIGQRANYGRDPNTAPNANSIVIGDGAALSTSTAYPAGGNVTIGAQAGGRYGGGVTNITIGNGAAYRNIGFGGVFIGHKAGLTSTIFAGTRNIIIGEHAYSMALQSGYNTLIGARTGDGITTGTSNIIVGNFAGSGTASPTMQGNIILGPLAAQNANLGNNNIIQGTLAAQNAAIGSNNIVLGYNAAKNMNGGAAASSSSNNIIIGLGAASEALSGMQFAVLIGQSVGKHISPNGGNYQIGVMIGLNAGYSVTTAAASVLIGQGAGSLITTGSNNTIFGHNAGTRIVDGISNVVIGGNAGGTYTASASAMSQNVIIGATAHTSPSGNTKYSVIIGSSAGSTNGGQWNTFIGHH
jgi:hypothetical protein